MAWEIPGSFLAGPSGFSTAPDCSVYETTSREVCCSASPSMNQEPTRNGQEYSWMIFAKTIPDHSWIFLAGSWIILGDALLLT